MIVPGTSFGDRFPDQFGDVDDEVRAALIRVVRGADLANADTYDIVESAVAVAVAEVEYGADDLSWPSGYARP
jgi:hypothetical protein